MTTDPLIIQIGLGILSGLIAINAFFIKSLVQKIDRSDKRSIELTNQLSRYEEQIRQIKEHIENFSIFARDLSDLKSEVAVLKYALDTKNHESSVRALNN